MCYTVPTVSAIITSAIWFKTKDVKTWWLALLFGGGAMFGIIDHWWNGELFLISENILSDLALGVVISLGIFMFWKVILVSVKINPTFARNINNSSE